MRQLVLAGSWCVVASLSCSGSGDRADPADRSGLTAGTSQCAPGDPATQRHGTDCLCCHATEFGVAGSVALAALAPAAPAALTVREIHVRDTSGSELVMSPNDAGNFLQHAMPALSLEAWIVGTDGRERHMQALAPTGSCNRCHAAGTPLGELGAR